MDEAYSRLSYTGAAPTGAGDTTLFSTVTAFPGKAQAQGSGVKRIVLDIAHDQAFDLKLHKSQDRGTNWVLVSTETIAVPASGTTVRDFNIEPYEDFRVLVTNGGSDQTTWVVDMALSLEV